jgi:GT2 family glycosyltransferase
MIEGRIIGLQDGVILGWIDSEGGEDAWLEALAHGEAPFGRVRAEPGEDGRLHFAIALPPAFRDGRIRFFDVRPLGSERPLDGGPVIFDGGLFTPSPPPPPAALDEAETRPPAVEGQVRLAPPAVAEGWAFAPDDPDRRLQLEILAGGRLIATIRADQSRPELEPQGRAGHAFRVDLERILRRGPHEVTIRVAGYAEPLPGGAFRTGGFARDGEVDCPGYLDDAESRALVARLPFEHLAFEARRVSAARLAPRLINRLRRERIGFAGAAAEPAVLLRLPGSGPDQASGAWALQSYPQTRTVEAEQGARAIRQGIEGAGHVFFAGPGDLLHPSAASIVARLGGPDAAVWSRFCADAARAGSAGTVLRRPPFDPVTVRHGAMTDTTLALRAEVLARAPEEALEALAAGRMHPLWFWLAGQGLDVRLHPEALTSSTGPPPMPASREEIEVDEGLYRRLLAEEGGGFTLERTAAGLPFPYVLAPARRAALTSVIVPFRGQSAVTLRCVMSLARQRLSGELELVLVDNQSEPDELKAILDGARAMLGEERVTSLSWDAPFNHSAQNNLGAEAAKGEVLLICNNDVELGEPDLIEQLGAWALQPGVGAVGCRLEDPERGTGSYGHICPPPSEDPFQPPLRENPDPAWGRHVHAVPGNTLALAAIARDRYLELGGLDAARFPAGYNDLDLMLRASAQGLTHLYLGHVGARHVRGSSRTGDNEDLQALWLNQAHPPGLERLAQLACVRIEAERPQAAAPAEAETEAAALRATLAERRAEELRRADAAGSLARASELVRRLEAELGR